MGHKGQIHWICYEESKLWVALLGKSLPVDSEDFTPRPLQQKNSPVDNDDFTGLTPETVVIDVHDAYTEAASTMKYSKDKGYDVTIGDLISVARGPHFGVQGLVHSVDFVEASLTVVSGEDGAKVHP
jgi:hypothetical protein